MTQNLDFKSPLGENEPVKPPFDTVYKNLCSLKFEVGSYLLKSVQKIVYTWANIRYSETFIKQTPSGLP